jgi:hypothetical protein
MWAMAAWSMHEICECQRVIGPLEHVGLATLRRRTGGPRLEHDAELDQRGHIDVTQGELVLKDVAEGTSGVRYEHGAVVSSRLHLDDAERFEYRLGSGRPDEALWVAGRAQERRALAGVG